MQAIIDEVLTQRIGVLSTTSADGIPAIAPVHFAKVGDEIVWLSSDLTTHSQNIERDGKVAFVAWLPDDVTKAVYIHSTARRLEGDEANIAFSAYEKLLGTYPKALEGAMVYAMPIGSIDDNSTTRNWVHTVA